VEGDVRGGRRGNGAYQGRGGACGREPDEFAPGTIVIQEVLHPLTEMRKR
jgi:hypothetical protein